MSDDGWLPDHVPGPNGPVRVVRSPRRDMPFVKLSKRPPNLVLHTTEGGTSLGTASVVSTKLGSAYATSPLRFSRRATVAGSPETWTTLAPTPSTDPTVRFTPALWNRASLSAPDRLRVYLTITVSASYSAACAVRSDRGSLAGVPGRTE